MVLRVLLSLGLENQSMNEFRFFILYIYIFHPWTWKARQKTYRITQMMCLRMKYLSLHCHMDLIANYSVSTCRANCPGLIHWANHCQLNNVPVTCESNIIKALRLGSVRAKRINKVSWKLSSSDVSSLLLASYLFLFYSIFYLNSFYFISFSCSIFYPL